MIDFSKIDQFRLYSKHMSTITPDNRYSFSFVFDSSFEDNLSDLEKVIGFLHDDLDWDGIPDLQKVKERLDFGSVCMFWKFESEVVGWSWLNNYNISLDWTSSYRKIKANEQYGGGAFLHRKSSPEPIAGYKFYRFGIQNMFESFNKDTLYLYSDSWNRASAYHSYKVGFTKYSFF